MIMSVIEKINEINPDYNNVKLSLKSRKKLLGA
jgi:hypothetical protein